MEGVMAKGAVWTYPSLRARIDYRSWTSDGLFRQASLKGSREDG